VLATRPQLPLQAIPLLAQIGGHRGEPVVTLVGARYTLFLGLGVVQRGDIRIQRDQPIGQGRNRCRHALQKRDGCLNDRLNKRRRVGIKPLAQRDGRGNLVDIQSRSEIRVLPERLDRFKVTLAQTQQPDIASQDFDMRYGIAPGRRRCRRIFRQVGVLRNRHPDESQSRVRSKISPRFRNDQPSHHVTCGVSLKNALF